MIYRVELRHTHLNTHFDFEDIKEAETFVKLAITHGKCDGKADFYAYIKVADEDTEQEG